MTSSPPLRPNDSIRSRVSADEPDSDFGSVPPTMTALSTAGFGSSRSALAAQPSEEGVFIPPSSRSIASKWLCVLSCESAAGT